MTTVKRTYALMALALAFITGMAVVTVVAHTDRAMAFATVITHEDQAVGGQAVECALFLTNEGE